MLTKLKSFCRAHKILTYSLVAGIIVSALWLSSWILLPYFYSVPSGAAELGDSFGVVNALFSGLAFVGLVTTLLMQHAELKMQREELQLTREEIKQTHQELKGQKEEIQEQNKTLRQQRFETTFFNMLSMHQNILESLVIEEATPFNKHHSKIEHRNRQSFLYYYLKNPFTENDSTPIRGLKKAIQTQGLAAKNIIKTNIFNNYFNTVHTIIAYVDKSPRMEINQAFEYITILKALFSRYELILLFYYALSSQAPMTLKPLLEKYAFFDNLGMNLIADSTHKALYEPSAYKHAI